LRVRFITILQFRKLEKYLYAAINFEGGFAVRLRSYSRRLRS
jgi:hypothetical protein